jgi:hypothetical protein
MHIRQGAQWTEREHPVVVLTWDMPWFPGAKGNILLWI